jgi:dephospho-CoA kinase
MTQKTALDIMKLGHSLFLTGGAGTGKTYVLNQYIAWCRSHAIDIAITASTGIAATHIGGSTLHSWAGIGIRDTLNEMDIDALLQKKNLYDRYNKTKVLIIDEISMLHAHRLDMVDKLARAMRRSGLPFGGIQVIMCGDFFQLPPINRNPGLTRDFAFYSDVWKKISPVICYLTVNYRQQDDSLHAILHAIRNGEVEDGVYDALQDALENPPSDFNDLPHTKLYTHNEDVDRINFENYKKLSGTEKTYVMENKGKKNIIEILKSSCLAHETLKLKVGARVMFIKNDIGKKYNNGTLGEVISFASDGLPVVKTLDGNNINVIADSWKYEEDGKVLGQIEQLPLRYAWAITVHKSQGMTLDAAEMDLSKSFGFGMGYVALSRVRSLAGLKLLGIQSSALSMHPDIVVYDEQLKLRSDRAIDALEKYSTDDIAKKQGDFILACGGSIEEIDIKESEAVQEKDKTPTKNITLKFIQEKKSLNEIAQLRSLTVGTIISHIEELCKTSQIKKDDIEYIVLEVLPKKTELKNMMLAFKNDDTKLSDAMSEYKKLSKSKDKNEVTFEMLRLARVWSKLSK